MRRCMGRERTGDYQRDEGTECDQSLIHCTNAPSTVIIYDTESIAKLEVRTGSDADGKALSKV